jgi:hypothetical protein
MILRNLIYEALKRGIQILVSLKSTMECGDYGKTVYGGPAPKPWQKRERLPLLPQRHAITLGSRVFHPYMAVGAVKQPYVARGKAKIPTPEIDAAWGEDSWLKAGDDESQEHLKRGLR